jgi:hypothetical protein
MPKEACYRVFDFKTIVPDYSSYQLEQYHLSRYTLHKAKEQEEGRPWLF